MVDSPAPPPRPSRSWKGRLRRWHRWLGVTIGIQFLAWTIGGIYFSWTDLDAVHGDDLIAPGPTLAEDFAGAPLGPILAELRTLPDWLRWHRIETRPLVDGAVYRVVFETRAGRSSRLFEAETGTPRGALSPDEAEALARATYAGDGALAEVRTLQATGPHHEYRGGPLPAQVYRFDDARATRIYVAPEEARVTSVRNSKWRLFDFLWMLHTMDYAGRDNLNNWLLRGFSLFGLATLSSGFALFFATERWGRR